MLLNQKLWVLQLKKVILFKQMFPFFASKRFSSDICQRITSPCLHVSLYVLTTVWWGKKKTRVILKARYYKNVHFSLHVSFFFVILTDKCILLVSELDVF